MLRYIRYIQISCTICVGIESSKRPLLCLQRAAPNGEYDIKGTHVGLPVQKTAFQKIAGVLEAIRRVYYMLWWVVSIFVIDVYLIIYLE